MIRDKKEIGIYLSVNEQISTFVSDSCAMLAFRVIVNVAYPVIGKDFVY